LVCKIILPSTATPRIYSGTALTIHEYIKGVYLYFRKTSTKRKSASKLWLNTPKKRKTITSPPRNAASNTIKPSTGELKGAPKKAVKRRATGKQLFEPSISEDVAVEIEGLIPTVLSKLCKEGLDTDFLQFN
jgi:hypothetical protein